MITIGPEQVRQMNGLVNSSLLVVNDHLINKKIEPGLGAYRANGCLIRSKFICAQAHAERWCATLAHLSGGVKVPVVMS